jgi:hypothetical protein
MNLMFLSFALVWYLGFVIRRLGQVYHAFSNANLVLALCLQQSQRIQFPDLAQAQQMQSISDLPLTGIRQPLKPPQRRLSPMRP